MSDNISKEFFKKNASKVFSFFKKQEFKGKEHYIQNQAMTL
jgi:hypothetical protein